MLDNTLKATGVKVSSPFLAADSKPFNTDSTNTKPRMHEGIPGIS